MTRDLVLALIISLVSTLILEECFALVAGKRGKKDLLLVGLVNVVTNPAVVLLYWLAVLYTDLNPIVVKAILEILAVLTEGRYYKKYGVNFSRPYLFSIAANAFSFGVGVILQKFI